MSSKKVSCLLALCFTLCASLSAQAQTLASARILSSEGPVEIQRPSPVKGLLQKIDYRANDELFAGDVIKTLNGGRLVLGLMDGSQAIIGEQTVIRIMDTSRSPRTIFNVLRGRTRVKIERAGGRPNPYRVNTPTTVIAVRGTLFDVIVTDGETQVFVHEGEVEVSNLAQPEVKVRLLPGQRTRVRHTQPPEAPSRFQPGRNDSQFNRERPDKDSGDGRRAQRAAGAEQSADRGEESERKGPSPEPARDSKGPGQEPGEVQQQGTTPLPGKPNSGGRRDDRRRSSRQFFSDNG